MHKHKLGTGEKPVRSTRSLSSREREEINAAGSVVGRREERKMSASLMRDYLLLDKLGEGSFGKVFRCLRLDSGEVFACKSIDKRVITDGKTLQRMQNEAGLHQQVSGHPNIVQIFDVREDEASLHLVMELCPSLDLYDRLSGRPLPEAEAKVVMTQLMQAIAHCHRLGVVHRDIKPENILFDGRNQLKLADFGLSESIREGEMLSGLYGSEFYMAPEILWRFPYNEKVDVWSAGVVLYILLTGVPPFGGDTIESTIRAILLTEPKFPNELFRNISSYARDLIRKMLRRDFFERYSADQVLGHPWFTFHR